MDKVNFDHLKQLKQRNILTEESYIKRVVDFAKVYMEKDMKLEILRLLERGTYGGKIITKEKGSSVELEAKIVITEKCPKQYIDIWPSLKHPNIVRLLDMQYLQRCDAYIFMTENYFCNLEKYLLPDVISQKPDSPQIVKNLLCDILSGLEYLHDRGYSHLALKAKNIFISKHYTAVISNFGSLSTTKEISKSTKIPLNYGPPELFYQNACNVDVCGASYDAWCFGILALNILTNGYMQKKIPEYSDWHDKVYPYLFKILQKRKFSKHIKRVFRASKIKKEARKVKINFIMTCLRINPVERPSPNMLLKHKYLMENDGFMIVNKGPWNKKPLVKADFWIEMLNRPSLNKSISKETVNENKTSSSENFSKKSSEESKSSDKGTETSKVDQKSKIDTIQNQNNNHCHTNSENRNQNDNHCPTNSENRNENQNNNHCPTNSENRNENQNNNHCSTNTGNRNKEIEESNSVIEDTSKIYTLLSESNDSAQIQYSGIMNSGKNDILINVKLNSYVSSKNSNPINADASIENPTNQELELDSTTSDDVSVRTILKYVQPTYEIDGVSQTVPKWLPSQYTKKMSSRKEGELSSSSKSNEDISSFMNVTHKVCGAGNSVLEDFYSDKPADEKNSENQNSFNTRSPSSSEKTMRFLKQKENTCEIPISTFQKVKVNTEILEHDVRVYGDIVSSNSTQEQDNKRLFEGDTSEYFEFKRH